MRPLACVVLVLLIVRPAAAGGMADNPAFCFGFVSAQSQTEADALSPRKPQIRSLFAKFGPKDSTDERGFDDWAGIGRKAASDRRDTAYATLLADCRRRLGSGGN